MSQGEFLNSKDFSRLGIMFLAAIAGIVLWLIFSFPRFSAIPISLDRQEAVATARQYLMSHGYTNVDEYLVSSVIHADRGTDRYLQRALGIQAANSFRERYQIDLFYWSIRFFKPKVKEEFNFLLSPRAGEVVSFKHMIDENAARPDPGLEAARARAWEFLRYKLGSLAEEMEIKDESTAKRDRRTDYNFSFRSVKVEIPWSQDSGQNAARLLSSVVISGDEVLGFDRLHLLVPDGFNRYVDAQREVGRNFSAVFNIAFLFILFVSVLQFVYSRQHIVMQSLKPFMLRLGAVLWLLIVLSFVNGHEALLSLYPTSQDLRSYLTRGYVDAAVGTIVLVGGMILVALAGHIVQGRTRLGGEKTTFFQSLQSSFLTRWTAVAVMQGIFMCCILLGVQGVLFSVGEKFFGVWVEQESVAGYSSAYLPFLAALTIGLKASLGEETMFRLLAVNWLYERGKNIVLAVAISSLIWGFGHAAYPIFPMWFRGAEVTILGLILCWAFLRYGLLTVLVAHFLFDAFLSSAGSLFSPSAPVYFWSAVAVLAVPLIWAAAAWVLNRDPRLRPLDWGLSASQAFNLGILKLFVEHARSQGRDLETLKTQVLSHHWDSAVVHKAFDAKPDENK